MPLLGQLGNICFFTFFPFIVSWLFLEVELALPARTSPMFHHDLFCFNVGVSTWIRIFQKNARRY
jgi:hypothetical protein